MSRHEETNKIREEKIREQDAQIQENLIKFCKHLHDNEEERIKAKNDIVKEGKQKEKYMRDMEEARLELEKEKKKRELIDRKLQYLKKYDDYLNQVITENHELYPTKTDIIQRHFTLKTSYDKLENSREKKERDLDELKKDFIQYEKTTTDQLLQLSNEIAGLQKTLEVRPAHQNLEAEKQKYEAILEGSKKVTFTETVIVGRIFMAIDNLRIRCQAFNSMLQKTKKRADKVPGRKKADSPGSPARQNEDSSSKKRSGRSGSPDKLNKTGSLERGSSNRPGPGSSPRAAPRSAVAGGKQSKTLADKKAAKHALPEIRSKRQVPAPETAPGESGPRLGESPKKHKDGETVVQTDSGDRVFNGRRS